MKYLLVSLLFATSFTSCVVLSPPYDSDLDTQVQFGAKLTDSVYADMIASPDKSYAPFAPRYAEIEAVINNLLLKEAVRPKNDAIISQANTVKSKFLQYQNDHKTKGSLSSAELIIYQEYMKAYWKTWTNSEKFLKPK